MSNQLSELINEFLFQSFILLVCMCIFSEVLATKYVIYAANIGPLYEWSGILFYSCLSVHPMILFLFLMNYNSESHEITCQDVCTKHSVVCCVFILRAHQCPVDQILWEPHMFFHIIAVVKCVFISTGTTNRFWKTKKNIVVSGFKLLIVNNLFSMCYTLCELP